MGVQVREPPIQTVIQVSKPYKMVPQPAQHVQAPCGTNKSEQRHPNFALLFVILLSRGFEKCFFPKSQNLPSESQAPRPKSLEASVKRVFVVMFGSP